MPILTVQSYQTLTAQSLTGSDLSAATGWCAAVSAAIENAIKPFRAEPLTVTDCILDAPPSRDLLLPVAPVRSITTVHYRGDANGVVGAFTSDYLIDNSDGDEYQLLIDDKINSWARAGILRRIGSVWGSSRVVYPDRLGSTLEPVRGALKVTFTAGATALPADIEAAAVLAVSLLLSRKKTGLPAVSESWNGYSASYAGPYTSTGVIQTPDIQSILAPYLPGLRIGA
jgi:hypothetical protein